jgi:ABC-type dipeptide/oligopeptide/nickel transport system permease component
MDPGGPAPETEINTGERGMAAYIARRLLLLPVVAFGVTVLIFSLLQVLPPASRAMLFIQNPEQASAIAAIIRKYDLDKPMYVQYGHWVRDLVHGDLGYSQSARMPVAQAIATFFPATLELTLYAFVAIVVVGVTLGTAAAVHRDGAVDQISRILSITGYSLPVFVWGLLLLLVFYGYLQWFPPERLSLGAGLYTQSAAFHPYTGLMTVDAVLNRTWWILWDALRHLVLPVATLTYFLAATLVRITRSAMLDALNQDYVRAARGKGLPEHTVVGRHARKNALVPVITLSSSILIGLLGGVVVTETIFDYPGIGRWGAAAALQLDVPAVAGFALLVAGITVFVNLAADVVYSYVDPRIRLR